MVRFASLAGTALLATLVLTQAGMSQPACDAPATNEWLRPGTAAPSGPALDASLVHPVTVDLADAAALLAGRPAVLLTWQDAARFVPGEVPARQYRPYLIRAVFPTPNPTVRVSWVGADLHVIANGLGCAPFLKHPLVVFLNRPPRQVFVWASSAL